MIDRRKLIQNASKFIAAPACSVGIFNVFAQNLSDKPIRWLIPAPAGSSLDVIARSMQTTLAAQLATSIVIENRPQAGGTVAANEVAKSAPDGHTWLLGFNGPVAFAPFLYSKLPYEPRRDLSPVMLTTSQPNVIAVHSSVAASNIQELLALIKARPGQLNYASVGNGSSSHLTMEYLKALTGAFAVHIPFNGSPPAVLATSSGETQILATVPTALLTQIKAGRLKALAVTGRTRYALTPNLPTVASSGLPELRDFEALAWNGVLVAGGTPRTIVERINAALNAALKEASVQERLKSAGLDAAGGSSEAFAQLIDAEARKWAPIIRRSGAKLD